MIFDNSNPIKVIEHKELFLNKIGVNEKQIEDFIKSSILGLIVAIIVFVCTSLTTWGFTFWIFTIGGIVFIPVLAPAISVLVGGTLVVYLLKRLHRKMSNEKNVVKFVNNPIDKLGIFISQLVFATLCIFFVKRNGENKFDDICNVMKEWGYSQEFIDSQNKTWLSLDENKILEISKFSWNVLKRAKSNHYKKDINPNKIKDILINLANDIATNEVDFSKNLELIKDLCTCKSK